MISENLKYNFFIKFVLQTSMDIRRVIFFVRKQTFFEMASGEKGDKDERRSSFSKKPEDGKKEVGPASEPGLLGLLGGLFGRRGDSSEDREKKEEEEYSKEMKRRDKAKVLNSRRERLLRPNERGSGSISEKFCTESNEEVQRGKSYNILIQSIDSLPPDVHKSIERMKVPLEDISQNLDVFLNVISFTDKHIPRRRSLISLSHLSLSLSLSLSLTLTFSLCLCHSLYLSV
jgi:hypothetical protein